MQKNEAIGDFAILPRSRRRIKRLTAGMRSTGNVRRNWIKLRITALPNGVKGYTLGRVEGKFMKTIPINTT